MTRRNSRLVHTPLSCRTGSAQAAWRMRRQGFVLNTAGHEASRAAEAHTHTYKVDFQRLTCLRLLQRGTELGNGCGAALGAVHHQLGQQGVVKGCTGTGWQQAARSQAATTNRLKRRLGLLGMMLSQLGQQAPINSARPCLHACRGQPVAALPDTSTPVSTQVSTRHSVRFGQATSPRVPVQGR